MTRMRFNKSVRYYLLVGILPVLEGLAILSTNPIFAQSESESAGVNDSTFIELHVTPDGSYGVTSDGHELEYNYSIDSFEEAVEPTTTKIIFGRSRPADEADPDDPEIPLLQDELEDIELIMEQAEKRAEEIKAKFKESRKPRSLIFGDITIEEDNIMKGPVVAVGKIIVRGTVEGDVISYKRITVTATGTITGDATAPDILKMRGGVIEGSRIETGLPPVPELDFISDQGSSVPIIANISIYFGLLLICLLIIALLRKPVEKITACLNLSFFKSFFVGLLFWFAIGPLIGLLVLTIIGIPVAAIALPMATVAGIIVGIACLSIFTGRLLSRDGGLFGKSKYGRFFLGFTLLNSFWLLMGFMMLFSSSVSQGFATLFMVLAIIVWSIGVSAGVGAVILTRFGTRDCKSSIKIKIDIEDAPPPPTPPPLKTDDE